MLSLRGESLLDRTYNDRRHYPAGVVAALHWLHPGLSLRLVPQWDSSEASFQRALAEGYEGVVIKRRDSRYLPGSRDGWWKLKRKSTADAFIVGYSPGQHGNTGLVGSFELAVRDPDGSDRPVAQVGNLTVGLRRRVTAPDGSLVPEAYGIVVEFSAQGLTRTGRARSAHLVRIRPDKGPGDCAADQVELFARS